jgi:hypothetical protein
MQLNQKKSLGVNRTVEAPAAGPTVLIIRPMSAVVSERLADQHCRILDVAETINTAREAIDAGRGGLVCGIPIGHQREALDAITQMFSELKRASETLTDIAKQIEPRFSLGAARRRPLCGKLGAMSDRGARDAQAGGGPWLIAPRKI